MNKNTLDVLNFTFTMTDGGLQLEGHAASGYVKHVFSFEEAWNLMEWLHDEHRDELYQASKQDDEPGLRIPPGHSVSSALRRQG